MVSSRQLVEGLEKTAFFTLGCPVVITGTDHKPLIPIINNLDITALDKNRARHYRLKEKFMCWNQQAQYIPAILLGGVDALSRYRITDERSDCELDVEPAAVL